MNIKQLKKKASQDINQVKTPEEFKKLYQKYLGRKGKILLILDELKHCPLDERKVRGQAINEFKSWLEEAFKTKERSLKEESYKKRIAEEKLDITQPASKVSSGHLHPLTKVTYQIEDIFQSLGFSVVEGPEIEDEYHNFDALNIPKDHPARDQWDTFWLKNGKNLLRTHTSPVQIRYMEKHFPPFRIIAPGRCFRHEATDASHDVQFKQVEGLMVGSEVTVANFKAVIEQFCTSFFGSRIQMRLRPSYFPFTEPSFEIDLRLRGGKWLEVVGAGLVHQNVFKAVGYQPYTWQGFAFGMGVERLAMLKYHIDDIRWFYNPDLRFSEQF